MATNVYVDAFNLYYGSLKGTPYRWPTSAPSTLVCCLAASTSPVERASLAGGRGRCSPDD